jgi:hypothetical protein
LILSHQNRCLSQNELFPLDRMIIGCPPCFTSRNVTVQSTSFELASRFKLTPASAAWMANFR